MGPAMGPREFIEVLSCKSITSDEKMQALTCAQLATTLEPCRRMKLTSEFFVSFLYLYVWQKAILDTLTMFLHTYLPKYYIQYDFHSFSVDNEVNCQYNFHIMRGCHFTYLNNEVIVHYWAVFIDRVRWYFISRCTTYTYVHTYTYFRSSWSIVSSTSCFLGTWRSRRFDMHC